MWPSLELLLPETVPLKVKTCLDKEKIITKLMVNPLYAGGLFHCFMFDEIIVILGVLGLFCHFYSIFDGKSC